MKTYLITGVGGFVAHHYLEHLAAYSEPITVIGIGTKAPKHVPPNLAFEFQSLDLLNTAAFNSVTERIKPDFIIHLAARSSVAKSWIDPLSSFSNNTNIFLNLLESVRKFSPDSRVLSVGSSEQYGIVDDASLPIEEAQPLQPVSPYAVARCSQELLAGVYCETYGLDIVMTRSFNHVGPFQSPVFVVSGFVSKFANAIVESKGVVVLNVGDLDIVRDFSDVCDVVNAYETILRRGESGLPYNVCSGIGIGLNDLIQRLSGLTGLRVRIEEDRSLFRPIENRRVVGSNKTLCNELGWQPVVKFDQSLDQMLQYWVDLKRL